MKPSSGRGGHSGSWLQLDMRGQGKRFPADSHGPIMAAPMDPFSPALVTRKSTDCRVTGATLWFLPVQTRVPLKFGTEALTSVTCARVRLRIVGPDGRTAEGWGETPLSVQWVWPSQSPYAPRHDALKLFCELLTKAWANFADWGHPLELGHDFTELLLPRLLEDFNASFRSADLRSGADPHPGPLPSLGAKGEGARRAGEGLAGSQPSTLNPQISSSVPWLAALVCCSAFDLALHDAYGNLHGQPTYDTYGPDFLNRDLAAFLHPAADSTVYFAGKFPADFLRPQRLDRLRAWHLVGGLDPLDASELRGDEPDDGYPVLLADWIRRDGLKCLKIKLRGNDAGWDYTRLVKVGQIAIAHDVEWLTADFNCTVHEPAYVCDILDRLRDKHPRLYGMLLYVEQPFPYELTEHPIAVHSVSARKPLFLDESAHDWKLVRRGRELGWTGVALKTCKTQSGALLSACWAQAHGMTLMVQDLTNPMLAQIPHCLLAAHVPTIMGVETNAMQFYPEASAPEAKVHPGLYQRRGGCVELGSITGTGFGYRLDEICRELPAVAASFGS
jgi:L-alanine-DL-glutamate epimerase-like enolase superfamily enzyme